MKKRNALLILGIALLALILLFVGRADRAVPSLPSPAPTGAETPGADGAYSDDVQKAVAAFFEEYPAESYLLLTTGNGTRAPIPLNGDNALRITQGDGSENVVHIGKNSFYMESSNCENQNCVQQGVVDLDNRETRILFNMVICLPHNLRLELVTRDEAESFLAQMLAMEESADAAGK